MEGEKMEGMERRKSRRRGTRGERRERKQKVQKDDLLLPNMFHSTCMLVAIHSESVSVLTLYQDNPSHGCQYTPCMGP